MLLRVLLSAVRPSVPVPRLVDPIELQLLTCQPTESLDGLIRLAVLATLTPFTVALFAALHAVEQAFRSSPEHTPAATALALDLPVMGGIDLGNPIGANLEFLPKRQAPPWRRGR